VASARPFTFRYAPPGREFKLELRFRRSEVDRQQIAAALREAAEKLENDN
jgi:ParB family chromosome partitioning protein